LILIITLVIAFITMIDAFPIVIDILLRRLWYIDSLHFSKLFLIILKIKSDLFYIL
jgi:hypothetical protein